MDAFTGAFHNMRYFMGNDIKVTTGSACPWTSAYINYIAIIVTGIEIRGGMTATIFIGMKDGKQVWIAAKAAIYIFCIPPHIANESIWPGNSRTDIIVVIHCDIVVVKFPVQQLVVLKPMFLPGGRWC